jgi:hypothetical protein
VIPNPCGGARIAGSVRADQSLSIRTIAATINLSERFLLQATLGFLACAVYGSDRLAYWQQVLESAEQAAPAAPARQPHRRA